MTRSEPMPVATNMPVTTTSEPVPVATNMKPPVPTVRTVMKGGLHDRDWEHKSAWSRNSQNLTCKCRPPLHKGQLVRRSTSRALQQSRRPLLRSRNLH